MNSSIKSVGLGRMRWFALTSFPDIPQGKDVGILMYQRIRNWWRSYWKLWGWAGLDTVLFSSFYSGNGFKIVHSGAQMNFQFQILTINFISPAYTLIKFHSTVFRMMVFLEKCKRLLKKKAVMKVLLNEELERENSPTSSDIFSFWHSDKNGKLIEEQNSVGCQYIQEKPKFISACRFKCCRQINVSFMVWFAKIVLQLISSRTRPSLLWLLQEFVWFAAGGNILYLEDFGGLHSYAIHKSFHHGPHKSRVLAFAFFSTYNCVVCVSTTLVRSSIMCFCFNLMRLWSYVHAHFLFSFFPFVFSSFIPLEFYPLEVVLLSRDLFYIFVVVVELIFSPLAICRNAIEVGS